MFALAITLFALAIYRSVFLGYNQLMIYQYGNIKTFLASEFRESRIKNPRYSLRAFAKKLKMAPSTLSEVLSGKKNVSVELAARIADSLSLKQNESEYICLLAEHGISKSEKRKAQVYNKLKSLNKKFSFIDLDTENFQMISEWYHFAILELLTLPNLNYEPKMLAKKLGITGFQFNDAVERLVTLGLAKKTDKGFEKISDASIRVSSKVKNIALRTFHNTMLERAKKYLEQQNPSERYVGSETLIFDEKDVPKANEIFEECFQKIIELSEKGKNPKHVFHAGIQFYALTKGEKNESDL